MLVLKDKGKTFEELLATDPLFIEYFNTFLELPAFPEPLAFNKETGGFEVKSLEKEKLTKEIKAAVRAGKKKKRIYRPVHNHAYSDIPLIPIEDPPVPLAKEINTSFTVQTLNKEQGIQWIKQERLPAFLQSELYIEYRLAKVISQAQQAQQIGEVVTMKIDYTPPPKKKDGQIEEEEPEVDEGETMMQKCYVSMGNAPTSDTDAWISQAKIAMSTTTTASSASKHTSPMSTGGAPTRPTSGRPTSGRPTSGRPSSAASLSSKLCAPTDSGVWSPTKSMFNSATPTNYTNSLYSTDDADDLENKLRDVDPMLTPRPSDSVCSFVEDGATLDRPKSGRRVYTTPQVINEDDESELSSIAEKLDEREKEFSDESNGEEVDLKETNKNKVEDFKSPPPLTKPVPDEPAIGGKEDSDDDSLLNSDDDYEGERDTFFRKDKPKKTYSLLKKRGIEQFKQFLKGNSGEINWLFWMDIERLKTLSSEQELTEYIAALRGRYQKNGAPYELSSATKMELKLNEPSHWTKEKLLSIQNSMAERLVLYWSLRFVLKEQAKVNPEKNFLYHNQKLLSSKHECFPNPAVENLLPLRAKSLMPRMEKPKLQIEDAFESTMSFRNFPPNVPKTSPPTGLHRTYQLPAMFQPPPDQKEEKEKQNAQQRKKQKTPKELIKSKIRARPPSAPASLGSRRVRINSGGETMSEMSSRKDPRRPCSARPASALRRPSSALKSSVSGARPGSAIRRPDSASRGDSFYSGSRPGSAASQRSVQSCESDVSEFAGGRRMEGLLQALCNEKNSGAFIRKYVKEAGNQLWSNALSFWEDLQKYHKMFYAEVIEPFHLQLRAKALYSVYIVNVGKKSIGCDQAIQDEIHYHLVPPYEELFDLAEEYVLTILFDAWSEAILTDMGTFDKVELLQEKRHLNTKSKYMVSLQRRGIIKDRPETPEEETEDYKDPVYDPALLGKVPEDFKDWTVDKLVHNRLELEHFRKFLEDNYASMDLMCWMDIEAFKRISHSDEKRRDLKCKDIKVKYFNKKYFFGPNSPAGKEGQEKIMAAGGGWGKLLDDKPPTASLLEAQKYVKDRLEKKWLPLFLATPAFAERQHLAFNMEDAVEDILIQKKKKSQAIWKMLESKWVSSSKDIITFRKALMNPVASLQFRKFVSIKGDNYENDVLFWQEVQKYKDLCHLHSDKSLVQQKTYAIIHCFIDSPIPPALQIDITQEMADKILERKFEATPYLFREAQLTVFRVLFSQWGDFCNFRMNLSSDKLMTTIERHRKKARAEEKKKQKELDEKRARDEAKRRALGLPVDGANPEDYDPFAKAGGGGGGGGSDDEDATSQHDKAAVSWSYSKYMRAFDQEEVLNEVDEETFSSLTEENLLTKIPEETSQNGTVDSSSSKDGSVPANQKPKSKSGSQANTAKPKAANSTQGSTAGHSKATKGAKD